MCFPVQLERPDSPEFGQNGPEDFQVDDVSKIDPGDNERAEVRHREDGIEVIQRLGSLQALSVWVNNERVASYRKEEVRDIVGDINRNADVGEMEAIAEPNKRQRDDVMANKLLEILPWFLQLQHQHDGLLSPVASLKEVVRLEQRLVFAMRETLEHGRGVEIPDIRSAHDVQPERTKDRKVYRRVGLFHEPRGFPLAADPAVDGPGPDHALHKKLSGEREDNRVERHKRNILLAFPVHGWATGVLWGLRVGQKDGAVHWVRGRGVDGICGEKDGQHQKRQQPGVFQA